ncbi:4444_t:CDS:2 [Ambispora gerdemannii]|uniref:4444_t:CDS:1 n=1 Tax=Ambispora gerdemannii TaxID=144530 RepID=A0A9N9AGL7_9GLOM|nr:4444_t:CDS:2 [Ambispora gerdemannii]
MDHHFASKKQFNCAVYSAIVQMSVSQSYLITLAIETLHFIMDELEDERNRLNFAMSCKWLYRVYRIYYVGFATPNWVPFNGGGSDDDEFNDGPPVANYRDGVLVDGALYVPILNEEQPVCWVLDFKQIVIKWDSVNITLGLDDQRYIPLRNTVTSAVRSLIYLFGGETIFGNPSNIFYELDPRSMVLRNVQSENNVVPSIRIMHSLNTIGNRHLVLFGGCSIIGDFYLYDISNKTWYSYPEEYRHALPYARAAHSSLTVGSSLYVHGGKRIRANTSSPSEIHDDEDLWEFNFANNINNEREINSDDDSNEEDSDNDNCGSSNSNASSNTRTSAATNTSSINKATGNNSSNIIQNFLRNKWQKLFSPRTSTSPFFTLGDESDWKETTGKVTGKRCGSAMFRIGKRVAILGGYEKDNWLHEEDITQPWEMCKIYLPERRRWDHVRIVGFPDMECVAFVRDHTGQPGNIFIMGRKKGDQSGKTVMGWIKDY